MKRLDLNWGGHKDGNTFVIPPSLVKSDKSDFLEQPEIAAMRTGVCVTRDADGYVKVVDTAGQIVMGIISFGFIDRLSTREAANASTNDSGEGLTVVNGRGSITLPGDMFSGDMSKVKSGVKVYAALSNGKPTTDVKLSDASLEIGYISEVENSNYTIEIKL